MKYLIVGIIILFAGSCSREIIWDEGEETTRTVRTATCDTVEFRGIFDVILIQDTAEFVTISHGRNLINYVRTFQKKGYIEISGNSGMNWTRNYKRPLIEMHFTRIHHICIYKGVRMQTHSPVKSDFLSIWDNSDVSELNMEIDCGEFKLSVSENNSGIFKISGRSLKSSLEPDGSAHFRTEGLIVDSCYVMHKGIGDCYVNVRNLLEGKITGKGNLLYKLYPSLKVQVDTGQGKIIPVSP